MKGATEGDRKVSEAEETVTRSGDGETGAKPSKSTAIIFGISVVGVMVVWVAFLIWFAVRVIF
jgi:hypothetical protein